MFAEKLRILKLMAAAFNTQRWGKCLNALLSAKREAILKKTRAMRRAARRAEQLFFRCGEKELSLVIKSHNKSYSDKWAVKEELALQHMHRAKKSYLKEVLQGTVTES